MTLLPVFDSTKAKVTISCGSVEDGVDDDIVDDDEIHRWPNVLCVTTVVLYTVLPVLLLLRRARRLPLLAVLHDHRQTMVESILIGVSDRFFRDFG